MKLKLTTIMAILAMTFTLSAQKGYVSSADYELTVEKPDLAKAEEKILAAEKHEKTIKYAKTYTVKSSVYRKMFAADNKNSDALFIASKALATAVELNNTGDAKGKGIGKYTEEIKKDYMLLRIDLQNCGANAYNEKNYELASKCFAEMLEIDAVPVNFTEEGVALIDTSIIFNTALCAYYNEDDANTEKYMVPCMEYGYGGSTPHTVMYLQYKAAGDTVKMVETLKDGFAKYPEDAVFLKDLVIYFINMNNIDEGMKYLAIALEQDPENSTFWFTKGTFYDQLKDTDKAIEAYKKAQETADDGTESYNANYNLAVIYYNDAVEDANVANDEKDMKKSAEMADAAMVKFTECIPYFEACLAEKPDDIETLKALRPVYYRLSSKDPSIMAKYEALQKQIKALEGN